MLRLYMQFFAEGASGDAAPAGDGSDSAANKQDTSKSEPDKNKTDSKDDLEKLVQARADKLTAESGKKIAALQKELDKMKREKMTADELKALEMSEKEQALAEREKALLDKENRLIAIKAIKEAGLDDGSENALELVDFVMAGTEDEIKGKVKAFGALVQKFVAAKVDKTFKQNGRNPNSGGNAENKDKETTAAEMLGKTRSEQQQKSRSILDKYTRRNNT